MTDDQKPPQLTAEPKESAKDLVNQIITNRPPGMVMQQPGRPQTDLELKRNPVAPDEAYKPGQDDAFSEFDILVGKVGARMPNHNVQVTRSGEHVAVFIVHNSTPPHLHESTNIQATLAASNGVVGPHLYFGGTEADVANKLVALLTGHEKEV